ncbi:unnamed protein product [Bemisia tabaci]|uniref:OV-16 antigen n=1 Tax=Bemisia tabaci TaxID=7038 RepID=A0A9P0A8G1_BEMTA|nr:unnamed protein product [Bemisia tabaci]
MGKIPFLYLKAFSTCTYFITLCASDEPSKELLRKTFESEKFVPDIFPEPPQELLKVTYNGVNVSLGGLIPFDLAADPPELIWNERDAYYTILMTDPDSPSRADPTEKELEHWVVGNIYKGNISSGQTFAEYEGPLDARVYVNEEGIHRYIISVFEQIGKQNFTGLCINNEDILFRGGFNTSHFVKEHKLKGPVAATYFTVDHEATKLRPTTTPASRVPNSIQIRDGRILR